MLAQIRGEHREIHARAAEPAVERLAAGLLLGRDLGELKEGGVAGEHGAVGLGHHHGIGLRAQHRGEVGPRRVVGSAMPLAREPDEEDPGVLLTEQRHRGACASRLAGQRDANRIGPSGRADGGEKLLHCRHVLAGKAVRQTPTDKAVAVSARHVLAPERPVRRRVGLKHLLRRAIDHKDGLTRELEQQPVPRLEMAQPRIILLERLLRLDQPLLERRDRAQVATEGDDALAVVDPQRRVEHRDVRPGRGRVVDLPPAGPV